MLILAVDTALKQGWAALGRDGEVLASRALDPARTHSATLQPAVQEMLAGQGLAPADLQGLAVDLGPGYFTGLRIGIAFSLGLALARGIKLAPLSSLALLAGGAAPGPDPVWAVIDARRGLVYAAPFRVSAGALPQALAEPAALAPELLGERLEAPCRLVGDGARLHAGLLAGPGKDLLPESHDTADPAVMISQARPAVRPGPGPGAGRYQRGLRAPLGRGGPLRPAPGGLSPGAMIPARGRWSPAWPRPWNSWWPNTPAWSAGCAGPPGRFAPRSAAPAPRSAAGPRSAATCRKAPFWPWSGSGPGLGPASRRTAAFWARPGAAWRPGAPPVCYSFNCRAILEGQRTPEQRRGA